MDFATVAAGWKRPIVVWERYPELAFGQDKGTYFTALLFFYTHVSYPFRVMNLPFPENRAFARPMAEANRGSKASSFDCLVTGGTCVNEPLSIQYERLLRRFMRFG